MAQGQVIVSINGEDMKGKAVQDVMDELHVRPAHLPHACGHNHSKNGLEFKPPPTATPCVWRSTLIVQ